VYRTVCMIFLWPMALLAARRLLSSDGIVAKGGPGDQGEQEHDEARYDKRGPHIRFPFSFLTPYTELASQSLEYLVDNLSFETVSSFWSTGTGCLWQKYPAHDRLHLFPSRRATGTLCNPALMAPLRGL
jgi:hypothetical protein